MEVAGRAKDWLIPILLSIHHLHSGAHGGQKKGLRSLGTKVTCGCEHPCGFCESDPGLLVQQAMLLTNEPSL